MLRDQGTVALNDLLVALKEAVTRYRTAARLDPALGQPLTALAAQHEWAVARLAGYLLAEGDLPDAPDPERELVDALVGRLKAALTGHPATLLAEAAERELRLAELATAAIAVVDEPALRALLEQVRAYSRDTAAAFGGG